MMGVEEIAQSKASISNRDMFVYQPARHKEADSRYGIDRSGPVKRTSADCVRF
jgi:hypothetical protein